MKKELTAEREREKAFTENENDELAKPQVFENVLSNFIKKVFQKNRILR